MDELFILMEKYQAANPDAENPFNFFSYLGDEGLIDMLKKEGAEDILVCPIEKMVK